MSDDALPELIAPMLAAPGALPPGPGWAFEFKYDGVRAVGYAGDGLRVLSRNHNDVTSTYPELGEVGELLGGRRAVLDGEIVALETGDRPSFSLLANRIHAVRPSAALLGTVPVVYYVFDVLHLDGESLLDAPYERRRAVLDDLGLAGATVRTPPHFTDADGQAVLRSAEIGGLEGVVAKRLSSPYRPGKRSADWTKVPLIRTQEVVVVGWKAGAGRRAGTVGSLLLAVHGDDGLVFAGHVGTGFTDAMLRRLGEELRALHRTSPPVGDVPREHARHARWVEPLLVGEVVFRNWTPDGRLRHPSWRGLRTDKYPSRPLKKETVEGAYETADRQWRVEVVRQRRDHFYRLINVPTGNVVGGLSIATVERLLSEAGVDMADLVHADAA
ncbi:hypothetical protein ACTI_51630 [Actinoplanes sp. OR16]|uniref:non-homologous end-joining DNA ligase n=1 Tax=Actinoplanes sp. OR16 TaxID=946334 RepID=UPI000F6D3CE7|nr:non-homologous end-joining DNA ligase [Actinoplanes sp. OR16]BBH68478.1 hypothetical protein ACTI_51630 [Actinoplanes sp. OR16]